MSSPSLPLLVALLASMFTGSLVAQDTTDDRTRNLPAFVDDSRRFEFSFSYVIQGSGINFIHIDGGEEEVNATEVERFSVEGTLAYFFDRYKTFGIEAQFGYTYASGFTQVPSDAEDPDNPVVYPVEDIGHKVFSYGGNLIYQFGYLEVVPFVIVGGGMNSFQPNEESSYPLEDTYPNLFAGFGFKYFLNEWFGARVQVTDSYFFLGSDDAAVGDANQIRLSIGAVLTF